MRLTRKQHFVDHVDHTLVSPYIRHNDRRCLARSTRDAHARGIFGNAQPLGCIDRFEIGGAFGNRFGWQIAIIDVTEHICLAIGLPSLGSLHAGRMTRHIRVLLENFASVRLHLGISILGLCALLPRGGGAGHLISSRHRVTFGYCGGEMFGMVDVVKAPDQTELMHQTARILKGTSYDEVWTLLLEGLGFFGITAVRYGLTRSRYGMSLGDLQDILFLSTLGEQDFTDYIEAGLYRRSPHYRWMAQNDGAVSWGWFDEEAKAGRLPQSECEFLDDLRRAGSPAGYLLSFPSDTTRLKGGLGMMGQRSWSQAQMDVLWAQHGEGIEAMCIAAHLNIARMPLPSKRSPLRPRQREMLEWVADGKSVQDVAVVTGLSVGTVEKHLRGAREALDVDTTAQAIARAALLGQLFVVEEVSTA